MESKYLSRNLTHVVVRFRRLDCYPAPDEIIVRNMEQRGDNVPATLHRHEVCFQRLWWRILRKIEQLADKRSKTGFDDFKRQFE